MSRNDSQLLSAVLELAGDNGLDRGLLLSVVQDSLGVVASSRRGSDIACEIDPTTEAIQFYAISGERGEKRIPIALTVDQLGRPGVRMLQQEMRRRLDQLAEERRVAEWQPHLGEVVTGTIERSARGPVMVRIGNMNNETQAVFPVEEQIASERGDYRPGKVLSFFVKGFTSSFPRYVLVSRCDLALVIKLLEHEVHELANGDIVVTAAARAAGQRTKIVVATARPDAKVDPAAVCIGIRGSRINRLRDRVPDNIDIISWSADPKQLILNALAVKDLTADTRVEIEGVGENGEPAATVYLPENASKGKVIGDDGVNVRLASRVSGYDIRVKSASDAVAEPS